MAYYSNFRRYTAKNERLSIFGRVVDGNQLEIFIIKCNPKDKFEKQIARFVYEKWLEGIDTSKWFAPIIYNVPIVDDNTPRWTFDRVCDTYFKKEVKMQQRLYEVAFLTNGAEEIEIKSSGRRMNKMI